MFFFLLRAIYRYTIALLKTVKIFARSFFFWPVKQWFVFWFTFPEYMKIPLSNFNFSIRTGTFCSKIVDLYMLVSCILDRQYGQINFAIGKDAIIDIGAHIGAFSIFAANIARENAIFSFEPDPKNYQQLQKNIELNGIKNIRAIEKAASSKNGEISFYHDEINTALNSAVRKTKNIIKVASLTLADIFENFQIKNCGLLKIDCEGSEYEIILNASPKTLSRIKKLVIEYHNPEFFDIRNEKYTPENLIRRLKTAGFNVRVEKENIIQGIIWANR